MRGLALIFLDYLLFRSEQKIKRVVAIQDNLKRSEDKYKVRGWKIKKKVERS